MEIGVIHPAAILDQRSFDEHAAHAGPQRRVNLVRLPRSPPDRLLTILYDLLTLVSPLAMHSRTGFVVPIRNRTDRRIYERMFAEDMFPLAQVARLVQGTSPTVADVGAHIGLFSLSVADWFPQARIHLFEPVPKLARRIAELARINGLADLWQVHQAVVCDRTGEQELHCPRTALGATLLAGKADELGGCRQVLRVPAVGLDEHAAKHGLDGFDIVKIDTEGVEYAAIASATRVLSASRLVFVRVFPPRTTCAGVDALLAPLGLRLVSRPDRGNHEHLWVRA